MERSLYFMVLVLVVFSIAVTSAQEIRVDFPFDNVVVQKHQDGNARLVVKGAVVNDTNVTELFVDYFGNSGLNGSESISVSENGTFYSIILLPKGLYQISVRDIGDALFDNVSNVGVGDVIVIAGQSNAVGSSAGGNLRANENVSYTLWNSDSIGTSTYTHWKNYTFAPLTRYERWSQPAYAASSRENMPVLIMNIARGGSSISEWTNSTNSVYSLGKKRIEYFTGGTMDVKAVYWMQGENEVIQNRTEDYYYVRLNSLVDLFLNELNVVDEKVVIGQTLKASNDYYLPDNVRKAQQRTWYGHANAYRGVLTYDIRLLPNGVHFDVVTSPIYTKRLWDTSSFQIYGIGNSEPPVVQRVRKIGSNLIDIKYDKQIVVKDYLGNSSNKSYGYVLSGSSGSLNDSNVLQTIVLNDTIRVVFDSSVSGMSNISICSQFTCYGKPVARGLNGMPGEIVFQKNIESTPPGVGSETKKEMQSLRKDSIFQQLDLEQCEHINGEGC